MQQPTVISDTTSPAPRIVKKKKSNFWLIWLLPLIASVIGMSIVWHDWSNRGPIITIEFESASGLEVGKTQIKYKDVVVGMVTGIRLSEAGEIVMVDAELSVNAKGLANEGTQFWVVKPTIGLSGVTGLSTLLSGVYINADTKSLLGDGRKKLQFIGLEQAPAISSNRPGSSFSLRSETLGSLGPGAPIYYLNIPVGVVTKYQLDDSGSHVDIDLFVNAPYDKYVGGHTRFWNESGIYVNVGADGLTVSTESIATILAGGLAFANFGPPISITPGHQFSLYENRVAASAVPIGVAVPITMSFYQSTKGLETGAPMTFQGVEIGTVTAADLDFDVYKGEFFTKVQATLYPARLGAVFQTMQRFNQSPEQATQSLAALVRRGLRAELKSANLLTGSLYVSLAIARDAAPLKDLVVKTPLELPTIVTPGFDDIQRDIASVVASINKIPFEQLGVELSGSLTEITELTKTLNNTLSPAFVTTLTDLQKTLDKVNGFMESSDVLPGQLDASLKEIDKAVRATKSLVDELSARPNSIIFGVPTQSYSRETLGATP